MGSLLDTESRNTVLGVRRNAVKSLEAEIRHSFYRDEKDAEEMLRARRLRQGLPADAPEGLEEAERGAPAAPGQQALAEGQD